MLLVRGSGILNLENQNLEKTFTKELINKCVKSQEELLKKALKILKKGNEMVYSTCSILSYENEDIINRVLKEIDAQIVPISLELENAQILKTSLEGTLCLAPNEFYEGFFIAKIRKK